MIIGDSPRPFAGRRRFGSLRFRAISALVVRIYLQFGGLTVTVLASELFRLSGIWNFLMTSRLGM